MKHSTNLHPLIGVMGVMALMVQLSCAMPLPIQNGVLTGPLNANRQAVINVGTLTFIDGTTLNTASGVGAKTNSGFTGTLTNLAPPTVAYSTNTFIQVSGAGLAPVNDNTYATNASFGSAYGYPIYVNASQTERISFWEAAPFGLQAGQSGWIIATNGYDRYGNTPVYFLAEGVAASPDLASNWLSVLPDSGGNLIANPLNNPPPALVSVQKISTNWVRHFYLAMFTNGVCVSITHGSMPLNPIRSPDGSSGTATNLMGAATNQVNALALAQAQAVLGALAPANVPVNTVVNAGAGLTVVSNSAAGVQTYTVSGISSNTLLGMAGAVIAGSNYLTSASSNSFAGSLNSGQVYGLGSVASLSSNAVLAMAAAAIAGNNYLTAVPGNVVTNGQSNVVLGGASLTLTNASGNSATINLEAIPGIWQSIQASSAGLIASGVLLNNGTLTANALNLNNGGSITGNGANLTNTPGPITMAGTNLTVTPVTNANTGQITYTVSGISSNTLLGMAGALIAGSNYLTSASSNKFAGSLNLGQVYGLGTVATLSSNTVLAMAGAAIAGSNYLTTLPGNVVTNGQTNVVLGGASFTLTNTGGTSATINLEAILGIWQTIQASPSGLVAAGVLLNNGTLTATAITLNNGGTITGNGANLTNTPGSITTAGTNVTVTPSTNAITGQITYSVAASGGGGGGGSSGALNAPYALSSNTNLIVDPVNGNYQAVILTNNTTVTWTNVSGAWANQGAFVRLEVFAGPFSLTWTTSTLATNLFTPSQLTTSNGIWNVYLIDKVAYGTANAKVYQTQ